MKEWMAYEIRMKVPMTECFKTPVYVRRFRLNVFKQLDEEMEEKIEEKRNNSSKGKRQSKLSGEELKTKLRNNEINPNNVG